MSAGDSSEVRIDAPTRQVLVHGPCEADLATVANRRAALGTDAHFSELTEPSALVAHVLQRLQPLLEAGAVYLDEARDTAPPGPRRDPASVRTVQGEDPGLFALGYLAGEWQDPLGALGAHIRLGREMVDLPSGEHALAWIAARGTPTDPASGDRERIIDHALQFGLSGPGHYLDELMDLGLVDEPVVEEIAAFAASCRLEPVLVGLGTPAEDPSGHYLGADTTHPVLRLTTAQHEVWKLAPLSASLLDAASSAGAADTTADLVSYLSLVRRLTAQGAAYLDRVRTAR